MQVTCPHQILALLFYKEDNSLGRERENTYTKNVTLTSSHPSGVKVGQCLHPRVSFLNRSSALLGPCCWAWFLLGQSARGSSESR